MLIENPKERRRTARIPVDAVLLYRAVGMDDYELCHVLNVSTLSLEILLDQALAEGTVVTIAVRPEGSLKQYYRVVGEVKRQEQLDVGWMHVITAPSERPWSPMFIYDVVCSTFDPVPNPVEAYETACRKGHYAELKECRADLDAWEASILPNRPVGSDQTSEQTSPATP